MGGLANMGQTLTPFIACELLVTLGHRKVYFLTCLCGAVAGVVMAVENPVTGLAIGVLLISVAYETLLMANTVWIAKLQRQEDQLTAQAIHDTVMLIGMASICYLMRTMEANFGWAVLGWTSSCTYVLIALCVLCCSKTYLPLAVDYNVAK